MRAVCHGARDFFALAGAACTVFAAVRHADSVTDSTSQNDFAIVDFKVAATGQDRDLECHTRLGSLVKMFH